MTAGVSSHPTMTTGRSIADRLSAAAGVRPSPEWLDACIRHLRGGCVESNANDDDAILHQILHADLRHVVRRFDRIGNDVEPPPGDSSVLLRRAIAQSAPPLSTTTTTMTSSPCKAVLPASFRLLVQAEELLDVSLNAEARAAVGPASSSSPTPVGNQRLRCLKILLSDGYFDNGGAFPPLLPNSQQNLTTARVLLVAMETSPIQNLSVNSKPGIKILLRGEITVRLGVLMLHEGNATVVGGNVPALIPIQKKAMEIAARWAGVGVDPTVRALIWNPHTGLEQDDDEGEQESRDVQAIPRALPALGQQLQAQGTNLSNVGFNTELMQNSYQSRKTSGALSRGTMPAARNHQLTTTTLQPTDLSPSPRPADSVAVTLSTTSPSIAPLSSRNSSSIGQALNPYSRATNPYTSSSSSTLVRTLTYNTSTSPSPSTKVQLNSNNTTGVVPPGTLQLSSFNSNTRVTTSSGTSNLPLDLTDLDDDDILPHFQNRPRPSLDQTPLIEVPLVTTTIYAPLTNSHGDSQENISIDGTSESATSQPVASSSCRAMSTTAFSEPLSFAEMRSLLEKVRNDPDLYTRFEGKTFVVPCKMRGQHLGFNIEKMRKQKRDRSLTNSKSDKYGYVIICHMAGTSEDNGVITCKLDNSILEPFFGVPPGVMRKMHREEKDKANSIVNEGGKQVVAELRTLASCQLKFIMSRHDFFSSKDGPPDVDGKVPLLLLFGRDE